MDVSNCGYPSKMMAAAADLEGFRGFNPLPRADTIQLNTEELGVLPSRGVARNLFWEGINFD